MTRSYETPRTGNAILELARLKAGLSQRELAARGGVPATMISAYERGVRQPTLPTLERLLAAAGFELRLHLAEADDHDVALATAEAGRTSDERRRRDRQIKVWRRAVPVTR